MANYHFTGIGGIGMSSLAQILNAQGHNVAGSDRNYDRDPNTTLFNKLKLQGIKLLPQDGSGVNKELRNVIVSSAIENDNLDIKRALEIKIPIITRSYLLAGIFNEQFGIAIGGSNGKTSVTAMTGWMLDCAGLDPTIIVGGYMKNHLTKTNPGNARLGQSKIITIEADESDGSVVEYKPNISVLTSISKDHKSIDELFTLFTIFANNTIDKLIINADCPNICKLRIDKKATVTYGIKNGADIMAEDIKLFPWGSTFRLAKDNFQLNLPGKFNISNALAAVSVARCLNIPDGKVIEALKGFKSVGCRMDIIGTVGNVKVINDYAHNPDKIKAAIDALRFARKRLIVIFQPHGYGPTRFLKDDLIKAFGTKLLDTDTLIMPEIYYAGGTVDRDISSKDIIHPLKDKGINAFFFLNRADIIEHLRTTVGDDVNILVLGARDDSLAGFCHEIIRVLKTR